MSLTEQLQNASDLAVIQSIITSLRSASPALTSEQTKFMQEMLWPWWAWTMQKTESSRKRYDSLFFEVLTREASFIADHRDHLTRLCEELWGGRAPEDTAFVLNLFLKLRTEGLMRSSSMCRCH